MDIQNNSLRANAPQFSARLFALDGMKQIKAFDRLSQLKGIDEVAKRGNKNTDIFVKNFISIEDGLAGYKNFADVEIKNPLFGHQKFSFDIHHATNSPINEDITYQMNNLDILTRKCNFLEDKAIKLSLIKRVKDAFKNKSEKLNPVDYLQDMLKNTPNHGFSDERINDFNRIAKNLLNSILKTGIENSKDL